jgi:hypothetical protein
VSVHHIKYYPKCYTIKIAHNKKEAGKIIKQIKELVGDSPYVTIYKDETGLSDEMEEELDRRYQVILKNPQEGKSWEEVKNNLNGQEFVFISCSINTHSSKDCKES